MDFVAYMAYMQCSHLIPAINYSYISMMLLRNKNVHIFVCFATLILIYCDNYNQTTAVLLSLHILMLD